MSNIIEVSPGEVYTYTPKNPNGDLAGKCNSLLDHCKFPDCGYTFLSIQQLMCPVCKNPREYCSADPISGRERCRNHGGMNSIGTTMIQHEGKGLSKILTTKLLDSYRAHYEDPDILNMTTDIALLNMRRDALIEKWQEQKVSESQWEDLKTAYEGLCRAIDLGHTNRVNEMLYNMGNVISDGYSDIMLWQEIRKVEEEITKIKSREVQRRKVAESVISEREFRTMMGYILSIIDSRVRDNDIKNQILIDLQKLNTL